MDDDERLSDTYIKQTIAGLERVRLKGPSMGLSTEEEIELAALVELQERRAADLGADELQWLRSFRDAMAKTAGGAPGVAILDKILAAHCASYFTRQRFIATCATPAQVASVAIFVASLAGDLDPIFAALVARWKAGDALALEMLLDYIHGGRPLARTQGWPKAGKHGTASNPHVFFLPWMQPLTGFSLEQLPVHSRASYQCTCGADGGEAYQLVHQIIRGRDLSALAKAYAATFLSGDRLDEDGLPAADYPSTET
jgi:hypothetical protein